MPIKLNFPLLTVAIFLLSAIAVFGQCEDSRVLNTSSLQASSSKVRLDFDFATRFKTTHKDLALLVVKPDSWIIFSPSILQKAKIASGDERIKLFEASSPTIRSISISGERGVEIDMGTPLIKGEKYLINVVNGSGIISDGCISGPIAINTSFLNTDVASPLPDTSAGSDVKKPRIVFNPSESREKADVFVEGLMEGTHKEKTGFTIDASISKRFRFGSIALSDASWKPFFNIKASTKDGADPDSLNFGVELEKAISFTSISAAGKFEADRDFQATNLIGDFRLRVFPSTLQKICGTKCNFVPFVGFEVGRNLRNPVAAAEGNLLARPLIGANLYVSIYQPKDDAGKFRRSVYIESLYERRFLLKREVAIDEDADGNLIGVQLSKAPRDYFNASATYDFARYFGFKLTYEYGSLPPLFKLVDSKFSLGLVFKGSFAKK